MGYSNLYTSLTQLLLNSIVTQVFDSPPSPPGPAGEEIYNLGPGFSIALVTHFLVVFFTSKKYILKV